MTGRTVNTEMKCGNCGRTVTEVNLQSELGTCLFCDLNQEGYGNE